MKVLSESKQYNIFIICKNRKIFGEHVAVLEKYKKKIHSYHFVKAVFLKPTDKNKEKTKKLKTRYNTSMKARLRKLGCIYAHRNALRMIKKLKSDNNIILEEDATLDHLLPNPPNKSTYLGGWIVPLQVSLAGKKQVKIPNLHRGLNEVDIDRFKVLMTHAYFVKNYKKAVEVLKVIEGPDPIKNYDIFLNNYHFFKNFYYPAIFIQSQHVSDIDGSINKNDLRSKNYGL
jgi:GR25 family glycosyltransferase involved in LPS biosynthesis